MAANPIVRSFPVYYGGRKVAEAFESTYGLNPNRKPLFGSEGYYAHSKGSPMTELHIQSVQPVKGMSVSLVTDCLAQNDVDIGIPIDAGYHVVTMAITKGQLVGKTEDGTLIGSWSLEGGPPQIQAFALGG